MLFSSAKNLYNRVTVVTLTYSKVPRVFHAPKKIFARRSSLAFFLLQILHAELCLKIFHHQSFSDLHFPAAIIREFLQGLYQRVVFATHGDQPSLACFALFPRDSILAVPCRTRQNNLDLYNGLDFTPPELTSNPCWVPNRCHDQK